MNFQKNTRLFIKAGTWNAVKYGLAVELSFKAGAFFSSMVNVHIDNAASSGRIYYPTGTGLYYDLNLDDHDTEN